MENLDKKIGKTPIYKLEACNENTIWIKLEGENMTGSIKDRLAHHLVMTAKAKGELQPGQEIVEVSSGNTGVALSHIGFELGHKVEVLLPDNADEDIIKKIKQFHGLPLLLPAYKGFNYALDIAREKAKGGYYWPNQYKNKESMQAYASLANELIVEVPAIDYLIAAIGTGGTIMGVGKNLQDKYPTIDITAVESDAADAIVGIRNSDSFYLGDNDIYQKGFPSRIIRIKNTEAKESLKLINEQGINASASSGAVFHTALILTKEIKWKNLVLISADGCLKNG